MCNYLTCDLEDVPQWCPAMCSVCNNRVDIIAYDRVVTGSTFPLVVELNSSVAGARIYVQIGHPASPGRNFVDEVRADLNSNFQPYLNISTGTSTLRVEVKLKSWLATPRSGYQLVVYLSQPVWARRAEGFATSGRHALQVAAQPVIDFSIDGSGNLPWINGYNGASPSFTLQASWRTSHLYNGTLRIIILVDGPPGRSGYINSRRTSALAQLPSEATSMPVQVTLASWSPTDSDYTIRLVLTDQLGWSHRLGTSQARRIRLSAPTVAIDGGYAQGGEFSDASTLLRVCKYPSQHVHVPLLFSTQVLEASRIIPIVSNEQRNGWVRRSTPNILQRGTVSRGSMALELNRWIPAGTFTVVLYITKDEEGWRSRYMRSNAITIEINECAALADGERNVFPSASDSSADNANNSNKNTTWTSMTIAAVIAGGSVVLLAVAAVYAHRRNPSAKSPVTAFASTDMETQHATSPSNAVAPGPVDAGDITVAERNFAYL